MPVGDNLDRLFAELPSPPPTVIAVSKYATLPQIKDAYAWGVRDFGENKMQDLLAKAPQLPDDIRWHFLGHLQRNKARKTLEMPIALIHSVDSVALATELSTRHASTGHIQHVLLQINWQGNPAQSGFSPADCKQVFASLLALPGIALKGLMVIAPDTPDSAEIESCFRGVNALCADLTRESGHLLPTLSMGMSGDFHHALNCGATMLRIGNRIFQSP